MCGYKEKNGRIDKEQTIRGAGKGKKNGLFKKDVGKGSPPFVEKEKGFLTCRSKEKNWGNGREGATSKGGKKKG